jgi:hypothetical protein
VASSSCRIGHSRDCVRDDLPQAVSGRELLVNGASGWRCGTREC